MDAFASGMKSRIESSLHHDAAYTAGAPSFPVTSPARRKTSRRTTFPRNNDASRGRRPLVEVSFASLFSPSSRALATETSTSVRSLAPSTLRCLVTLPSLSSNMRHVGESASSASHPRRPGAPAMASASSVSKLVSSERAHADDVVVASSSPARATRDDARYRPRRIAPTGARERATRATDARWARMSLGTFVATTSDETSRVRDASDRATRANDANGRDERPVVTFRRRRRARREREGARARGVDDAEATKSSARDDDDDAGAW